MGAYACGGMIGADLTPSRTGEKVSFRVNIPLGVLIGANMNSVADQAIAMAAASYIVRRVTVCNASTSLTTAAGGLYTGAGKTGTILVAAAQVYTTLTGATLYLDLTLTAAAAVLLAVSPLYFALTTGQGGAATADVRLYGDILA